MRDTKMEIKKKLKKVEESPELLDQIIDGKKEIQVKDVNHFRDVIDINSIIKIKGKKYKIKQIVKFRFDDGSYYMKLFLENGYVLADDLGGNSFILVKEEKTGLKIKEGKINYKGKNFNFIYSAHATAEEIEGEEIFKKGESESFCDYTSKQGDYLSLGTIDKTKERLDFIGKIVYSNDLQILKMDKKYLEKLSE